MLPTTSSYTTRKAGNISFFSFIIFFSKKIFPPTAIEWNKLTPNLRISDSKSAIKKYIKLYTTKYVKIQINNLFNWHSPKALKSTTQLRLGLSYLNYHKF